MLTDRVVQLLIQGVVALLLLGMAAWYAYTGVAVPDWLIAVIVAVLGVLFGFSAANGANNYRKSRK